MKQNLVIIIKINLEMQRKKYVVEDEEYPLSFVCSDLDVRFLPVFLTETSMIKLSMRCLL